MDEPTTRAIPKPGRGFGETIEQIQKDTGMTVFLTTHYMEEAAKADYVVVIDHGLIAAKGTPAQLKEQYTSDYLILHGGIGGKSKTLSGRWAVSMKPMRTPLPLSWSLPWMPCRSWTSAGTASEALRSYKALWMTLLLRSPAGVEGMRALVKRNLLLFFRSRDGGFFSLLSCVCHHRFVPSLLGRCDEERFQEARQMPGP